mgnify:CR=1 FL=1
MTQRNGDFSAHYNVFDKCHHALDKLTIHQ